jgi:hypothetical protein
VYGGIDLAFPFGEKVNFVLLVLAFLSPQLGRQRAALEMNVVVDDDD